ncbi:hypothetical protein K9U39_06680 [Rhodoblastus acidophilus]|uniref:Uncharacterized protein n=1 Tax=Candidatus Rhodoblastus alkanivorans TaxID=2954117 RepID=A0ABS9Z6L1_9HYPH|nr:hypothetical protein [Candidatus Rhodoblastus alkanivorans]MCI4679573.1 hypothetical protein [Candidatus Rhodoblastus alkanivorans]MCI4683324.1 hypothetical protein [Candidatus Rhodoblastus alkanivorans]MDI4640637.1 hypothetical protein [Rhodoblastus acidophilus]
MTSVLTGVAAAAGQSAVNSFCSQAEGKTDVNKIISILKSAGGSSVDQLAGVLNSVGSITSVVKCACETEQGAGSLGSNIGACMEDALCSLQEALGGGSCYCTRPPPALARCAAVNQKCEKVMYTEWWRYPECQGIGASGSIFNTNPNGQNSGGYMQPWQSTLSVTTTPEGTLVQQLPPTAEGTGCGGVHYCFCPAPMKINWVHVPNPGSDREFYVLACDCPEGTHPGDVMPNGISSCLCDNTNQPAMLSGLAVHGICPPPACPAGQSRMGGDGPCVTPCADPKQGMAFDGSCCDPKQMSSCGKCCPLDTFPNSQTGSCEPRPQPPK